MYKCFKCGTEFEGKFCPNCGEKRKEDITCRNCGTKSNGSARFCSECGKSLLYTEENKNSVPQNKSKKSTIIGIVAVVAAIAVFCLIILLCTLNSCGGETYYKLESNGELDKTTFFVLKSGKWEDEDGESGTYKTDGDKIVLYFEFFGEEEELCDGTLKDGVLKVNGDTFVTEKAKENMPNGQQKNLFTVSNLSVAAWTTRIN